MTYFKQMAKSVHFSIISIQKFTSIAEKHANTVSLGKDLLTPTQSTRKKKYRTSEHPLCFTHPIWIETEYWE